MSILKGFFFWFPRLSFNFINHSHQVLVWSMQMNSMITINWSLISFIFVSLWKRSPEYSPCANMVREKRRERERERKWMNWLRYPFSKSVYTFNCDNITHNIDNYSSRKIINWGFYSQLLVESQMWLQCVYVGFVPNMKW